MRKTRPRRIQSGFASAFAAFLLLSLIVPLSACAATSPKAPEILTHEGGSFPESGGITVRSGLSWLNETAPVFRPLAKELAELLKAKGLSVVEAAPSAVEPMPVTELPPDADALSSPAPRGKKGVPPAAADGAVQQRAAELAREGKLPQLKLREYAAPRKDADLPESVRKVAPPNVERALFALSQQKGVPLVRSLALIPGRMPSELAQDAATAKYALIVRFALMQPPSSMSGLAGSYSGAAFGGSGSLGFGPPAPPGASAPPGGYGTPGGYVRGYESPAGPNDIWGRDRDFFQRDYMLKNSPPPPTAEPPSGLSPSMDGVPGGRAGAPSERGGGYYAPRQTLHILQMECYDLAPMRQGKKPVMVWRASAQRLANEKPLASSLPDMAKAVFAATH